MAAPVAHPPPAPSPPPPLDQALPSELDMLLPLAVDDPGAPNEHTLRRRHTRKKLAFLSYCFAAECFASAGMSAFIPLSLEQTARAHGFSDAGHTIPCSSSSSDAASSAGSSSSVCKAPLFGVLWIDSSSFALYTFSLAVLVQALAVISLSSIADHPAQRKRLLLGFALVGSLSALLFPLVTSASALALLAVVGITSFGVSFVCLNSYLPDLGKGGPDVRAARSQLEDEIDRLAVAREQAGGGGARADERPGLMLPGVEFAAGQQDDDDRQEAAPLLEDEVLTGQAHEARLTALQQAYIAALSLYTASVSLTGIAVGYGGGVLLYVPCFLLVSALDGSTLSLRLSVGLSGAMWLVATAPALVWLGDGSASKGAGATRSTGGAVGWRHEVAASWRNLGRMVRVREIKRLGNLFWFLLAWFFLSDACATFTSTSIIFAKTTLGMKSSEVTIVAFIAQLTGVVGGFAAPTLQRRLDWSNKTCMSALVGVMASICLYGCLGLVGGEDGVGGLRTAGEMYAVAGLFGATFGPFQAFARTVFSELIPPGQEARWFSLYSITDKSSSFFGPAVVGLIADLTGNVRFGFIFLLLVLALPIPLLWIKVDVDEGRDQARVYSEAEAKPARP